MLSSLSVAHAQHSATLNWTAPAVVTGVAYTAVNVLRGPATTGPFTSLATFAPTVVTFTDTTVAAGQTYFYVLNSVAGTQTSVNSTAIVAAIPAAGLPIVGDRIKVTAGANIRATAPASGFGTLLGAEPAGALGTVVSAPVATTLGFSWVQVKFDTCVATIPNCTGYMGSDNLTIIITPPPPPTPVLTVNCVGLVCTITGTNFPAATAYSVSVSAGGKTVVATGALP